jgi:carbon storage regulator CsrA
MLVLTRNSGQSIQIDNDITVTVYQVPNSNQIKVCIEAPESIPIVRTELLPEQE